jgi:hypothetical protein
MTTTPTLEPTITSPAETVFPATGPTTTVTESVVEPAKTDPAALIKAPEAKPVAAEPVLAEALKLPEGLIVEPDQMTAFLGLVNDEAKTPLERAQALIDLQASAAKQASEKASQAWEKTQTEWIDQVKNDSEIGPKLDEKLGEISKLVDKYGSPELVAALTMTGAGNNLAVVRFFSKIADVLKEGTPISGQPTSTAERTLAQILYG